MLPSEDAISRPDTAVAACRTVMRVEHAWKMASWSDTLMQFKEMADQEVHMIQPWFNLLAPCRDSLMGFSMDEASLGQPFRLVSRDSFRKEGEAGSTEAGEMEPVAGTEP